MVFVVCRFPFVSYPVFSISCLLSSSPNPFRSFPILLFSSQFISDAFLVLSFPYRFRSAPDHLSSHPFPFSSCRVRFCSGLVGSRLLISSSRHFHSFPIPITSHPLQSVSHRINSVLFQISSVLLLFESIHFTQRRTRTCPSLRRSIVRSLGVLRRKASARQAHGQTRQA